MDSFANKIPQFVNSPGLSFEMKQTLPVCYIRRFATSLCRTCPEEESWYWLELSITCSKYLICTEQLSISKFKVEKQLCPMKCYFINPEAIVTGTIIYFLLCIFIIIHRFCVKETHRRIQKVKHISLTSSATAMRFLSELSYILVPFCSAVQTQP